MKYPHSVAAVIVASKPLKPFTIHPKDFETIKKILKRDKKNKYRFSYDGNYYLIWKR